MSRPSTREPVSEQQREDFIEELAAGKTVVEAAAATGRGRRDFYRLKQQDETFAAEWKTAYQEGTDKLVAEAHRRAVDGWDEPVFHKGEQVSMIRRYDSTLLMFLIKQRDSSYRENSQLKIEGGDKPLIVEHRGVKLTDVLNVARAAGLEPGD